MALIFEICDAEEGGYCARALGDAIFTEAGTWEELRLTRPRLAQLHYVKDELIPLEAA
ncbi:MAG: 2-oxoisovalerate dehydrogenase [Bryobacteraceae bacterium]